MSKWIMSANTTKWDLASYFDEDGYVDWETDKKFQIKDIIYIYCKQPVEKVMFKTVVDDVFDLGEDSKKIIIRISLVKQVDTDDLSLEKLRENGLINPPTTAYRFYGDLQNYIEKFFDEDIQEPIDIEVIKEECKLWMVRAGEDSVKINAFKDHNFVGIGWDLGDLSGKNKEGIKSLYIEKYGKATNSVSQINSFVNEIKVGDYILTSNNKNRQYLLGKCTSDYHISNELDDTNTYPKYVHCRTVEWLCEINWDDVSKETNNVIVSKSVFEIKNMPKYELLEFYILFLLNTTEKRDKIYFGAPGTGKSYNLNKCKNNLLKDYDENNYERVTFHPDYTYANFVGTYKPVPKEDNPDSITYKYVPGPFMRTLVKALKNPFEPYVLIIEEINRANVAAVFGDVFQLLDRENYISQYPINASEDIHYYLEEEFDISEVPEEMRALLACHWNYLIGENYDKITIPGNMFIWATMNSADQGVFPMDTAFKRRWNFEYLDIDNGESNIENIMVNLNGNEIFWNKLRKTINHELVQEYGINEDKLIGPFFAFTEYISNDNELIKIDSNVFKEVFENKIIMYLFEDVARSRRNELFEGVEKDSNLTYSQICKEFEKIDTDIFCDNISKKSFK